MTTNKQPAISCDVQRAGGVNVDHSMELAQIQSGDLCEICISFGKNLHQIHFTPDLRGS